jgi:hypothetical protein
MKMRNPGLGATEYFSFRLYDSEYLDGGEVEDFVGWREAGDVPLILNERTAVAHAWDKFTFAILAGAHGLPVAKLRAVYRPGIALKSRIADVTLDSPAQLSAWLRTQQNWPLFAKPVYAVGGFGAFNFIGYRPEGDVLLTKRAEKIDVAQFVSKFVLNAGAKNDSHAYKRQLGYLFQEVLRPHERIAALLENETISGVRVILIQDGSGVEIVSAEWKIVTGNSDTDNIRDYGHGNIGAQVDLASGQIRRVVDNKWPSAKLITHHPRTHRPLKGFVLPDWDETLALCRRAAPKFPLMRIQHWDVALTDQGPRLLEVNDPGSLEGQIYGRGVLTDRMRALLVRHGNPSKHALARRLSRTS